PASFFVSVAYMCWAYRRRGAVLDATGEVVDWLYQVPSEFNPSLGQDVGVVDLKPRPESVRLRTPLAEADVRALKAGDMVLLTGVLYTGRDAVHHYLAKGGDLDALNGQVIYHCGPVVLEEGGAYRVVAAGPTTSIREEPYQADVIRRFGVRAVIG